MRFAILTINQKWNEKENCLGDLLFSLPWMKINIFFKNKGTAKKLGIFQQFMNIAKLKIKIN